MDGNPLSIALVTETYPPELNGVALTVERAVRYLRDRGHRVDLVRPRQGKECTDDALLVRGFPLPRYPELQFGAPSVLRLLRHWRRERPDVVHIVTEGPLGWAALLAARQLGVPVSSDYRTHFQRYSGFYRLGGLAGVIGGALRAFHNRCDLSFVPTPLLAVELEAEGYRRLACVGRGVDCALFSPARRSARLRAEWGVGEDELVVLHVGRLAPEKNPALAREAFRAIRRERPEARMVWVGDGPLRAQLEHEAPDEIFAGVQRGEALAAHYASADLFLFPSLSETFGNVVTEAMASGLPIVAFDNGAAHAHLTDQLDARVVPQPQDGLPAAAAGEAFIEAARLLAGQPQRRAQFGAAAREAACRLAWPVVLDRFESRLQMLATSARAYDRAPSAA
ncbi:MAG: glycosyltransferase family 1 protein [Thauera sp.]|nr:glycosyltransferase family 1 protein [Thauera sp.]